MVNTLLFDLAWVILFPRDRTYHGILNKLHRELVGNVDYQFLKVFEFDEDLLNYIKGLKSKYEVDLFTSGTIQEVPEAKAKLLGVFEKELSAEKLGVSKRESRAYEMVAKILNKRPEEILFVDDNLTNVEAARAAGMQGIVYVGFEDFKKRVIF